MISIRQVAALTCAGTLAWDFFLDPNIYDSFSAWAMLSHFVYFQLPLKSKALAYLHPTSFIGSCLIPPMYIFLIIWNPRLELNNMELWELNWTTIVVRSILINIAPLCFHALDITSNQDNLISSYSTKPKKLMLFWSWSSFVLMGFIFEIMYPETEETKELQGINREDFLKLNKVVGFVFLSFSYTLLYLLVLRRAYRSNRGVKSSK
mmetsp:Transcript_28630/g.48102  ORF Transcript_28630/g.48102 Transcript_28630/m.48102 type:complete len:207 (-) Transcript_28630:1094-1714(-)